MLKFARPASVITLALCCACLFSCTAQAQQQQAPAPPPAELQKKIDDLASALAATQRTIEQSQHQMQQLQQQLDQLRQQMAAANAIPASATEPSPTEAETAAAIPIEEQQQATQAAVKVLDQTKVESASKYPVRLTGLILFNSYLNRGLPDNTDLPAVALRHTATSGNGSLGATLRQTILGIQANGPNVLGARTSANINIDFFNGLSYTSYGTSAGTVRMRTASVDLDWQHNSLEVGIVAPLISPRSPDSYATVAEPSLSGAGNLWTWAPQLRFAHTVSLPHRDRLQLELGLWDPSSAGYNTNQLFRNASPGELSQQPAYESRLSYTARDGNGPEIGVGGYYSRQAYPGYGGSTYTEHLDSWASTFDLRLPVTHHFELTGEGYRGRSIAGLGGGVYKDVIQGTSPVSGLATLHGLNAIGGWAQWKTRFTQDLDTNLAMGLDDGFASDFHAVVQPSTASASQLRARNRAFVANLIYRPKTYIILSPEFRRVWSWPINSTASSLNIFTMSIGFAF